ncbi:nickel ABC transporter permease [Thioflexithrix psekupsensis]|uniref:Glutathione ABC transporter permease GsiC n=1 Tax=Thioflexithrix psekupsensis TaxID=1570016 RepID=A0A251X4M3_9GAMM|nr:nickel ABC transporter permease [Thioflexithrix psekupsensis]OUD12048.1 glutathione ABC transporter permease GsiC [Thioflexithrix psekupsensis]
MISLWSRFFSTLLVLFGVSTLVFFLIHLVPGDPVQAMLGENAAAADQQALFIALGLDQPLWTQWWRFFSNTLQGDLGTSLYSKEPVTQLILARLPTTALLAVAGLTVAIVLAVPLGSLAALHQNRAWDDVAMTFAMLGVSIPNFLMGPLLILIFALWLAWLPVSGYESLWSLVLPALTLGTALAAILSRMIRATLLEVLHEDYIRTAYAKGLNARQVILRHALPNAALPVITILGLQLGTLLAGAVITEMVFSWPGLGQLTIEAIQRRDYPVVQGCVLLISAVYVVVNSMTDMLYHWLDPRVRYHD